MKTVRALLFVVAMAILTGMALEATGMALEAKLCPRVQAADRAQPELPEPKEVAKDVGVSFSVDRIEDPETGVICYLRGTHGISCVMPTAH